MNMPYGYDPSNPYAQPPAPQYPPQQGYPPAYAPPVYPPANVPPQPPQQKGATGNIDDFYSQPSAGGGKAVSWKDMPNGFTVTGIVAREITSGDISQDTDPKTGQLKFFRDGRPMFSMAVPLQGVQTNLPHVTFEDGEARLFVRGKLRDELSRAMSEAGRPQGSAPEAGAIVQVTLTERRGGGGGIPTNHFRVSYTPPNGAAPAAPPVQQSAPDPAAGLGWQSAPAAQQWTTPPVGPQYGQLQVPLQHPPADQSVLAEHGPMHPVQQPQAPAVAPVAAPEAPAPQQPGPAAQAVAELPPVPSLPDGGTPEQRALFARITGGQQ